VSGADKVVAEGHPSGEHVPDVPPGDPFAEARVLGAPGASVVIISGPSGVGKDTIIEAMRHAPRSDRHYVVTCTTREKRWYEEDGVDYRFLSLEAFHELREQGGFLEAAEVHGNWYGTPRDQVAGALVAGKDAILKIDVAGARAVRDVVSEALLVFVVPPSLDELRRRLVGRDTEPSEALERRWHNAAYELLRQAEYDHVVVNHTGQADRSAAEIEAIIAAEHAAHPDRRLRV
jgi:guanylate kinase